MKSFLFLFLSLTLALSAADVAGKWAGSYDVAMSDGDTMKGKVTLTLQQDGGAVTGTAGSDQGQMKILNGKLDGDKLSFELQTEQHKIMFDLRLQEDEHLKGEGKGEADGNKLNVKLDLTRS